MSFLMLRIVIVRWHISHTASLLPSMLGIKKMSCWFSIDTLKQNLSNRNHITNAIEKSTSIRFGMITEYAQINHRELDTTESVTNRMISNSSCKICQISKKKFVFIPTSERNFEFSPNLTWNDGRRGLWWELRRVWSLDMDGTLIKIIFWCKREP